MWKVFQRNRRIRRENLSLHEEDAKRLLAYAPNTPRDVKLSISPLIMVNKNFFFDPFDLCSRLVEDKKTFHATVPLKGLLYWAKHRPYCVCYLYYAKGYINLIKK
jgi:hypothetical protein